MLSEINFSDLFNDNSLEYFQTQDGIYIIYPIPVKKFYLFLKKIWNLLIKQNDFFDFFIKNKKYLEEIINSTLNSNLELDEDEIISLFFKIIKINTPQYQDSSLKKDTYFDIKKFKEGISTLLTSIETSLQTYIKLKKSSLEEDFGNISDGPFLYCKINGYFCNPSCKYYFEEDCKYKYYNLKYISFKGLIVIINLLLESNLEDKNFIYKLLTGEDLLDKITSGELKRTIHREEEKFDLNEEEIKNNISKIILKEYKTLGLIPKVSYIGKNIERKIKEGNISPDDLSIDEIITLMIKYDIIFCDSLKYLLFIRENYYKNEFPYNEDYSLKKAQEEFETYQQLLKKDKSLIDKTYKFWNEERYNIFKKAFQNNDILMMKITFNNYYWYWYSEYFKNFQEEIKIQDLLLKYIIDIIIQKYTYCFAHGIYIVENEKNIKIIKEYLDKIRLCLDNIDLSPYIVEGNIYLINKEELVKYLKNKEKDKKLEINKKFLLKNIDKFEKLNILEKMEISIP